MVIIWIEWFKCIAFVVLMILILQGALAGVARYRVLPLTVGIPVGCIMLYPPTCSPE